MVPGTSWVNPRHQARSAGPSERGQVRPLRGPAELGADPGGAGARGALDPMPDGQPCSCRPEARSALDGRVGMGSNDGVLSAERAPLERPAAHTRGLPIRREPDQDEARSRVAASVSEGGPCSLIRASAMLSHPRRLPGGGEPGSTLCSTDRQPAGAPGGLGRYASRCRHSRGREAPQSSMQSAGGGQSPVGCTGMLKSGRPASGPR
jgi:hypothetical protein